MTTLRVSPEIFQMFPGATLGVVLFAGIGNKGENPQVLSELQREQASVAQRFAGISIPEHPHIAPWRDAYRRFGAKPKENPSSIENLLRRVLKGHRVPHINLLVDIYNTVSLRHIVPIGGEDLEQISGDVDLTIAGESELPVKMLGDAEARSPKPGEVIYKDNRGAICRRWNWKEAERTKFTEATTNGFLVIERLNPVEISLVQQALHDLVRSVETFCGGIVRTAIVSETNPSVSLLV